MDQELASLHTIANRAIAFLVGYSFQVAGVFLGNWMATINKDQPLP